MNVTSQGRTRSDVEPGQRSPRWQGRWGLRLCFWTGALLAWNCMAGPGPATASGHPRRKGGAAPAPATNAQPATVNTNLFAPVPDGHPLAGLWNEATFQRRLLGSYGFHGSWEPPMTEEERRIWRDQVLPALRENPERAVEAVRPWVKPDGSAVFDFTLGTALFQAGDLTNAVTWLESAVVKHPEYLRAWKNLGYVAARLGDHAGTVRALARVLELGGADAATLGLLGHAYLQLGRPMAAAAATQQALLFRPEDPFLQMQMLQAWTASGQYEPALRLVDEMVASQPERASFWAWKARLHLMRNERAAAAVAYETLRRLGAARSEDLFTLADLYVLLETPETALGVYQEALRTGVPAGWERALRAAEVLMGQGQMVVARQFLETLGEGQLDQVPVEHQAQWLRLQARLAMSQGQWDRALEFLGVCLERFPLDGPALLLAADCYEQKGDREKAEFRYQAAAQIEAVAPDALLKHAQLLVRHQEYRRAAELLQRAQRLRPRDTVQRYLDEVLKLATLRPVTS